MSRYIDLLHVLLTTRLAGYGGNNVSRFSSNLSILQLHSVTRVSFICRPYHSSVHASSAAYFFLIRLSNSGARCLALFFGYLFCSFL